MPMLHSKHWFILLKLFSSSSKSYIKVLTFSMTRVLHVRCFRMYSDQVLDSWATKALSSIRISVSIWAFCGPHNSLPVHASSQSRRRRMSSTSCLQTVQQWQVKKRTITEKDRKLKHCFPIPPEIPENFSFRSLPPFHRTPHKGPRWVWWPLSYHPTRPDGRLAPSSTVCRP